MGGQDGIEPPTFRFQVWQPPRFQLDLERVDVVLDETGQGFAVLFDGDSLALLAVVTAAADANLVGAFGAYALLRVSCEGWPEDRMLG